MSTQGEMVAFDGTIYLLTEKEGGRRTPAKSGSFRTDIKFKEEVRFCSVASADEFIYPGETKQVVIKVLLHEQSEIQYLLDIGRWLLFDGSTLIAEVYDPKLVLT